MQSVLISRIWTRVAVSISYDDNHYTTGTSPDDGPKSGRKYLRNKQLWKIYQSIPAEYYKINTAIWKDQQ